MNKKQSINFYIQNHIITALKNTLDTSYCQNCDMDLFVDSMHAIVKDLENNSESVFRPYVLRLQSLCQNFFREYFKRESLLDDSASMRKCTSIHYIFIKLYRCIQVPQSTTASHVLPASEVCKRFVNLPSDAECAKTAYLIKVHYTSVRKLKSTAEYLVSQYRKAQERTLKKTIRDVLVYVIRDLKCSFESISYAMNRWYMEEFIQDQDHEIFAKHAYQACIFYFELQARAENTVFKEGLSFHNLSIDFLNIFRQAPIHKSKWHLYLPSLIKLMKYCNANKGVIPLPDVFFYKRGCKYLERHLDFESIMSNLSSAAKKEYAKLRLNHISIDNSGVCINALCNLYSLIPAQVKRMLSIMPAGSVLESICYNYSTFSPGNPTSIRKFFSIIITKIQISLKSYVNIATTTYLERILHAVFRAIACSDVFTNAEILSILRKLGTPIIEGCKLRAKRPVWDPSGLDRYWRLVYVWEDLASFCVNCCDGFYGDSSKDIHSYISHHIVVPIIRMGLNNIPVIPILKAHSSGKFGSALDALVCTKKFKRRILDHAASGDDTYDLVRYGKSLVTLDELLEVCYDADLEQFLYRNSYFFSKKKYIKKVLTILLRYFNNLNTNSEKVTRIYQRYRTAITLSFTRSIHNKYALDWLYRMGAPVEKLIF